MSVSSDSQLPSQPPQGNVIYTPLGGDGFRAPHSMFEFVIGLAGDASGGSSTIDLAFDDRYSCLLSILSINEVAATADVPFAAFVEARQTYRIAGSLLFNASNARAIAQWSPPPIIGERALQVNIANGGVGTTLQVSGIVLNFDRLAPERIPLDILLAAIPHASNLIP